MTNAQPDPKRKPRSRKRVPSRTKAPAVDPAPLPVAEPEADPRRVNGRFVPIEAWRQEPAAPGTFVAWAQSQSMGSAELAVFFDLNRATVLELLAGRRWPSARTAMQIAESTGDAVWCWDIRQVACKMRVRVRPPEPRPKTGKRR